MRKIYLVLFIFLICCGCTAKYELKINKDLTIEESITGIENNEFFNYFSIPKSKVIDLSLSQYMSYLRVQKYNRNEFAMDSQYGATFSKKFNSIDDYLKYSSIYLQYYESFNIKKDNNIVVVSAEKPLGPEENFSNRIIVDDGVISITVPFKVLDHNADSVDKKNNVYSWKFNSQKANKVYLKFDVNKNNDGGNLNFIVAIFSIVVLLIAGFFGYRIYKKKASIRNDF